MNRELNSVYFLKNEIIRKMGNLCKFRDMAKLFQF